MKGGAVKLYDLLAKRVLASRESAKTLRPEIEKLAANAVDQIELDFAGVEAMTTSFIDEVLTILEEVTEQRGRDIVVTHLAAHLVPRLELVARGHHLAVGRESEDVWILRLVA